MIELLEVLEVLGKKLKLKYLKIRGVRKFEELNSLRNWIAKVGRLEKIR